MKHTITEQVGEFKRIVQLWPDYDKTHIDPSKNYGVHGVDLICALVGELGAITFTVFTNWMIPSVQKEIDNEPPYPILPYRFYQPQLADVSYHSHVSHYEDQYSHDDCEYIGGKCYCDGSVLQAQDVMDILRVEGLDGVWKELERRYDMWLKDRE